MKPSHEISERLEGWAAWRAGRRSPARAQSPAQAQGSAPPPRSNQGRLKASARARRAFYRSALLNGYIADAADRPPTAGVPTDRYTVQENLRLLDLVAALRPSLSSPASANKGARLFPHGGSSLMKLTEYQERLVSDAAEDAVRDLLINEPGADVEACRAKARLAAARMRAAMEAAQEVIEGEVKA